jgi:2-(1,2-epoxy-1,2-dihydrophenyl)acetyl-CoA isomerase
MAPAAFETIIYEKSDGIATITLNRPDVLNAVNEKMGQELQEALKTAERDPDIRCLIITGKGRAFCAGESTQRTTITFSLEQSTYEAW